VSASVGTPFWCYLSARVSGLIVLQKRRRLFVMVTGDEIVVTSDTGFRAAYLCRIGSLGFIVIVSVVVLFWERQPHSTLIVEEVHMRLWIAS
jgi:hypothetical protein